MSSTSFDPRRLTTEVARLLEEHGVGVNRDAGASADRIAGAGMLLRGLGVEPLAEPQDVLDLDGGRRYDSRMHSD